MTYLESVGLLLNRYVPLVVGTEWIDSLTEDVSDYRHSIEAFGGFKSCEFTFTGSIGQVERWVNYPLAQHIEVKDKAQNVCWAGFINSVSISSGSNTVTIGPLIDISNRLLVSYTPKILGSIPPKYGNETTTTAADNTDSQELYGIWEKVVSGGRCTAEEAERKRDTTLAERAFPTPSGTLSSGGQTATVRVECRGYFDWLYAYTYAYVAASGTQAISTIIQSILATSPNAVFSADYSEIDTNAFLVSEYFGENDYAADIIQDLVSLGDANDNRWTFGIYGNQRAEYRQIPTTIDYVARVYANDTDCKTSTGGVVRPWSVRPARWVEKIDFLLDRSGPVPSNLSSNLRYQFIESVEYTLPYGLTINGGKTGTLEQLMAKDSVGGFAA